ncbi:hypothetical protein LshimejAT787_0309180 [Lyophyllum shimeji]|uniref:Uncharacterized protein n=1 Tax=Lyophyllum shimeji TaxID=47721 RepID=A0A9P3PI79_LYOSH|nr:hypothetical protein LshimejAT787_0309180 [Lyophyllum shimeji]
MFERHPLALSRPVPASVIEEISMSSPSGAEKLKIPGNLATEHQSPLIAPARGGPTCASRHAVFLQCSAPDARSKFQPPAELHYTKKMDSSH